MCLTLSLHEEIVKWKSTSQSDPNIEVIFESFVHVFERNLSEGYSSSAERNATICLDKIAAIGRKDLEVAPLCYFYGRLFEWNLNNGYSTSAKINLEKTIRRMIQIAPSQLVSYTRLFFAEIIKWNANRGYLTSAEQLAKELSDLVTRYGHPIDIEKQIPQMRKDDVSDEVGITVLISYKQIDAWFAEKVFAYLSRKYPKRVIPLLDKFEIVAGDSLPEMLDRLLTKYNVAIMIMSPDYFSERGWARAEKESILSRRVRDKVRFIPVLLRGNHSIIPPLIANYKYVNFTRYEKTRDESEFERRMEEVIKGILERRRTS